MAEDRATTSQTAGAVQAASLAELCADFTFFTPALLLTRAKLPEDPVAAYSAEFKIDNPDEQPFAADFEQPMFQGLGVSRLNGQMVNWDHRLYGIVNHRWAECRNFLAGVLTLDRRTGIYCRACWHNLRIVDYYALQRRPGQSKLPEVAVTVFAVSGNKEFVHIAPAVDAPRTRPYPQIDPPEPSAVTEAKALLSLPPGAARGKLVL